MSTKAPSLLVVILSALLASCGGSGESSTAPPPVTNTEIDIAQPWSTAEPAAVGMDEAQLARAVNDAEAIPRFRSLLVARHGQLVSESYFGGSQSSTLFDVRSVTKSVVSLLVGLALQSGKLAGLQATVGDYLSAPYVLDDGDRAVTVKELLTMTSGYQWDDTVDYNPWALSSDHIQFLLDRPQTGPPGPFVYDSAAANLLAFILQKAVAEPLPQYAGEVLLQPIGISNVTWEQLEADMVNGGAGLQMTARDMLRVGQLVLQSGRSGGQQIVPTEWIAMVTSPQFSWRDTDGPQQGVTYGYLWWLAESPSTVAYFAWGYGGQFVYVVPSLDMVIVTTTDWQGFIAEGVDPVAFAETILAVIVNDVLPAAHS
jgi:CubicO group peptidase (beta-lactamase class C family)